MNRVTFTSAFASLFPRRAALRTVALSHASPGQRVPLLAAMLLLPLFLAASVPASAKASLPDGRALEMVSPPDKNGADIAEIEGDNGGGVVQTSEDGETITYVSFGSFAEPQSAPIGSQYLAARRVGVGWLTQNISTPTSSQTFGFGGGGIPYRAFSLDLSRGLVFGGGRGGSESQLPVESPPLPNTDAPTGYEDLYLEDFGSGSFQSLLTKSNIPSVLPEAFSMQFLGSTPDLSDVVIQSPNVLAPPAVEEPGTHNLYEWNRATGQFQSVNVLPEGLPEAAHHVELGGGVSPSRAISADGSRVVWTTQSTPSLYVRGGLGTTQPWTVAADAPVGEGEFLTASSDDRKIFFADRHPLTPESRESSGRSLGDLYRFEPEGAEGSRLVDLVPDHVDVEGAAVQGVLGASEDGSYVYFVANGVLAHNEGVRGERAELGDCVVGQAHTGDTCNLYLWHEGDGTRFIARLSGYDESVGINQFNGLGVAHDWTSSLGLRTTRVSRDGTSLVFMSEESLTGYDNTINAGPGCGTVGTGKSPLPLHCEEVFLYEASAAGAGRLSCVSCNQSGARPVGPSGIPGATLFKLGIGQYQSRLLSEGGGGGRVFFDSADALVPQDTNGVEDVYEYENGQNYLLSSGASAAGGRFVDASVDGDDVFFITRARLVDQDVDQSVDLYDARAPHVPGERVGFPAQAIPATCGGEDCRPSGPAAPVYGAPSSALFMGLGNAPTATSEPVAKPKKAKPKKHKIKQTGRTKVKRFGRGSARDRKASGARKRARS